MRNSSGLFVFLLLVLAAPLLVLAGAAVRASDAQRVGGKIALLAQAHEACALRTGNPAKSFNLNAQRRRTSGDTCSTPKDNRL